MNVHGWLILEHNAHTKLFKPNFTIYQYIGSHWYINIHACLCIFMIVAALFSFGVHICERVCQCAYMNFIRTWEWQNIFTHELWIHFFQIKIYGQGEIPLMMWLLLFSFPPRPPSIRVLDSLALSCMFIHDFSLRDSLEKLVYFQIVPLSTSP